MKSCVWTGTAALGANGFASFVTLLMNGLAYAVVVVVVINGFKLGCSATT